MTADLVMRMRASDVPRTATPTSATPSTRMLSQRPSRTCGQASAKYSAEKNDSLTRGQPGESLSVITTSAMNVSEEPMLVRIERRRSPLRNRSRSCSTALTPYPLMSGILRTTPIGNEKKKRPGSRCPVVRLQSA